MVCTLSDQWKYDDGLFVVGQLNRCYFTLFSRMESLYHDFVSIQEELRGSSKLSLTGDNLTRIITLMLHCCKRNSY